MNEILPLDRSVQPTHQQSKNQPTISYQHNNRAPINHNNYYYYNHHYYYYT